RILAPNGPARLENLEMRRGDMRAIAPAHQHAILGVAKIRDAHRQPYSDRGQCNGKGKSGDVGQHAMAKIVRIIPRLLKARQIVRLAASRVLARILLAQMPWGWLSHRARPEFEHAVLLFRHDGLLVLHAASSGRS